MVSSSLTEPWAPRGWGEVFIGWMGRRAGQTQTATRLDTEKGSFAQETCRRSPGTPYSALRFGKTP